MTASLPTSGPNRALPHRRSRALGAFALLAASAVALSSCEAPRVRLETDVPTLPSLTRIDAIRDTAARTESAAADRAADLATNATSCPACAEVLTSIASNSRSRLEAFGGVWDPWNGNPPKGAQTVPAVASAPVTVDEFASWLAQTARRDLAAAADPEETASTDALALATAALGRYRSAQALASVYGLSIDEGGAAVSDLNERLRSIAGSDSLSLLGTWGLDPDALASGALLAAPDLSKDTALGDSAELAESIASWDCAAQSLPRAQLVAQSVSDASTRQDVLFSRVDALLSAGATDERTLRCSLDDLDATSLANALIAADLHLLDSDDATVRTIGARAALEDLGNWTNGADASAPALIGARS